MTPPKKSLGQNWLNSPSAIKKIVEAGNVTNTDTVLEVGPGKGALTGALLATGAKVVAIEKDHRLLEELSITFKTEIKSNQLILLEEDILQISATTLKALVGPSYKVIANIPYYITGELIRFFLSHTLQPTQMVILVQKEVAERIVSRDKKESILSLSVKAYGTPKFIGKVPAGAFIPAPKVDSAILCISNINRNQFTNVTEDQFFAIVKQGFAQKRKLLRGNLNLSKETLLLCNINPDTRAEDVPIDKWFCLTKIHHVS